MAIRIPDLGRIKSQIGYQPKVQLDEILKRVIDHFRTEMK